MKKLKCIKELDALYDFRQYLLELKKDTKSVFVNITLDSCIDLLNAYINKVYPPIKKEK